MEKIKSTSQKRAFILSVLVPVMILFTTFFFYPFLKNIYYMFMDYNYLKAPTFIGPQNIQRLFHDEKAFSAIRNTFLITICATPVMICVSLALAVLADKLAAGKALIRSCIFVTHLTSTVVAAIIFKCWFNESLGIVNTLLVKLGITGKPWLTDTTWALFGIIILSIWLKVGYYFVLYLAGLSNIDSQLYEAAAIDGATGWKMFFSITLPQLKPVITLTTITAVISGLNCYVEAQVLTGGAPYGTTKTALMYMFEVGFNARNVGYGCTIAVAMFLITLVITLIQLRVQRGLGTD